jgi:hypothetical protein
MSTSQECNALLLLANTAAGKLMQPDSERLQQEKTKHADNILLQQECEKHTAEIEKLQNTCAQLSIRVTQIEAELKAHKEREQLEKEQERCEVNAIVFMQQQANYKKIHVQRQLELFSTQVDVSFAKMQEWWESLQAKKKAAQHDNNTTQRVMNVATEFWWKDSLKWLNTLENQLQTKEQKTEMMQIMQLTPEDLSNLRNLKVFNTASARKLVLKTRRAIAMFLDIKQKLQTNKQQQPTEHSSKGKEQMSLMPTSNMQPDMQVDSASSVQPTGMQASSAMSVKQASMFVKHTRQFKPKSGAPSRGYDRGESLPQVYDAERLWKVDQRVQFKPQSQHQKKYGLGNLETGVITKIIKDPSKFVFYYFIKVEDYFDKEGQKQDVIVHCQINSLAHLPAPAFTSTAAASSAPGGSLFAP